MELNEFELRSGTRFIVGKWQVDFVVSLFSDDLAHIPAAEFKSDDGKDLSGICYEFFEDNTMVMTDSASGKRESGTWEQTGAYEYHYTLGAFMELPEGDFRKAAETLQVVDGCLAFSIGFLTLGMKKIAEGKVTEPADTGDTEMSAEDAANTGIVGSYRVIKSLNYFGDEIKLATKEEIAESAKKANSDIDIKEVLDIFDLVVEFTADHKIRQWMKIPENLSEATIKEALESGEILAAKDGRFITTEQQWKCLDGKFYYDTGEQREVFGEMVSSWDEIKPNEDGTIPFSSGLILIERI